MSDQVRQTLLFRYLKLKRRAKRGAKESEASVEEPFPPLHELIDAIWGVSPTVGARHTPRLEDNKKLKTGQRYIVLLRRTVHAKSKAVLLRLCVYTGGESHGFAPKDLDQAEGAVSYQQVEDDEGRILEPGVEFSVLLLGRVVLIQNRQGTGAAGAVQKALHRFGRELHGSSFVLPQFVAVSPKSIADQIEKAGGVVGVSFGVAQVEDSDGVTTPLHDIHTLEERLGGDRSRVKVTATGDATLDAEASLQLLEDPESDGLESVTLHLKDNQTISGQRMVLSKHVTVPLSNGVPDCDQVDKELLKYLHELTTVEHDGEQSVNRDGHIGGKLKIVSYKTKKG